ncbi:Uncharacterised protein r2_g3947 [Pycnogonum litorale]
MAQEVLSTIVSEVKTAKYFAVCVDSTPDISHVDQLTFILRFVDVCGKPEERFMKFIPISGHDGETLATAIFDTLREHGIPISCCRGQNYDNASNMSGKYQSVQSKNQTRESFGRVYTLFCKLVESGWNMCCRVLCQCCFILWIGTSYLQLLFCIHTPMGNPFRFH